MEFFHYESSKTKKVRFKKNFLKYLKEEDQMGIEKLKKKIHTLKIRITGNQNQPIENKDFYFYIMVKFIMIGKI